MTHQDMLAQGLDHCAPCDAYYPQDRIHTLDGFPICVDCLQADMHARAVARRALFGPNHPTGV